MLDSSKIIRDMEKVNYIKKMEQYKMKCGKKENYIKCQLIFMEINMLDNGFMVNGVVKASLL